MRQGNWKIIVLSIVLLGIMSFVLVSSGITGSFVFESNSDNAELDFDRTYTTAICEGNACRDFEIVCLDREAVRIDAVSGVVIFPSDWKDGRSEEDKKLCDR